MLRFVTLMVFCWLCACFDLNGPPYGGAGEPCWPRGKILCDTGLTCTTDGICRTVPPDTRQECVASLDCEADFACDNGRCTTYIAACGRDDSDCRPDYFCAVDRCAKRVPAPSICARDVECISGNCSDGVCCDLACDGVCESCRLAINAVADGLCAFVPPGFDPEEECSADVACDGAGACAYKALGAPCTADFECSSGSCADGVCCDGFCNSACERCNEDGTCAAVLNTEDAGRCDDIHTAGDCVTPPCICDGLGDCKSGGGVSCTSAVNCSNGQACVDGVCCDTLCSGPCQACVASKSGGTTGICSPIPLGLDPDAECPGVTVCTGTSQCFSKPLGQSCDYHFECASEHCSFSSGICCTSDCSGSCVVCPSSGASPGVCQPLASGTACSEHVCQRWPTCGPGDDFEAGSCSPDGRCLLPSGTRCHASSQCASNVCVFGPIAGACQ